MMGILLKLIKATVGFGMIHTYGDKNYIDIKQTPLLYLWKFYTLTMISRPLQFIMVVTLCENYQLQINIFSSIALISNLMQN